MKIQVCTGKTCKERFSEYIISRLERDKESFGLDNLIIEPCACTGNCKEGPNILVDGKPEKHCNPIKASKFAFQLKQKSKKGFVTSEDKSKRSSSSHPSSETDSSEETLYLKDHITLIKKTPDDTTDI